MSLLMMNHMDVPKGTKIQDFVKHLLDEVYNSRGKSLCLISIVSSPQCFKLLVQEAKRQGHGLVKQIKVFLGAVQSYARSKGQLQLLQEDNQKPTEKAPTEKDPKIRIFAKSSDDCKKAFDQLKWDIMEMLLKCRKEVPVESNPYMSEAKSHEKTGIPSQSSAGLPLVETEMETPAEKKRLSVKPTTKPPAMNPTLMTQTEFVAEHFAAAEHFFGKDLARDCRGERKDGRVFVSFFDTERARQTKRDIEALNVENVDVLMTNETDMKYFTKELMKDYKSVYVQLKSDGKSIAVISNEWNEIAEVRKKILQKYGVVKPKTRRNRYFKSDTISTEQVKPETLISDGAYYQNGKQKNQKHSTPSVSQNTFDVGCLKVKVYQTDMTKLTIDAIVNATNGNLSHDSGVAHAISKAAGQKLEKESQSYVHQNGKIPVTGVVPTTAGDMPCKMVLHAVGPAWNDYKHSEKEQCIEDLCKTIIRCLIVANEKRAESLAIPPISSGLFKVPEDQCCQAFVRGTRLFAEAVVGKIHLKEVHFVDVKADMVDYMKTAFSILKTLPLNATRNEEKFLKLNMPTLSSKQGV